MDWVVIENIRPYDGRYELDLAERVLSTTEWGWVKRMAGYLPGNFEEGLAGLDPELICAFAVIAMHRAGKIEARDARQVFDRVAEAPFGSAIRLDSDTADEEATEILPPPPPPSSSTNGDSSGDASPKSSGTSDVTPDRSGILASGSSGSVPERWAT